MKTRFLLTGLLAIAALPALTALRQNDKWTTLFDGKRITGWHSYHKENVVGWSVEDGALTPDGTGGDLVSDNQYGDFDLEFEFKIPAGSNSGVIYKVVDRPDLKSTYMSGPEFQIIDDKGWRDATNSDFRLADNQLTGANYGLMAPADLSLPKPIGEWNKGRILVSKNHVEHYLNGRKVVDYTYGSDDWKAMVSKSKFADWLYATPHKTGKIALQNHSPKEKVWFRAIRIREL